jgi:hypothetical protein
VPTEKEKQKSKQRIYRVPVWRLRQEGGEARPSWATR